MAEHTEEALAARLVETYSDRLLRLAYSILNSVPDAQDVCQEVLLKRLEYPGAFENEKHEQAWMVRVTVNACKNVRRSPWRTRTVGLDAVAEPAAFQPEEGGVLEEVQRLPAKYREVLVLYYYLGYDTNEIGGDPGPAGRCGADPDEPGPDEIKACIGGIGLWQAIGMSWSG